MVKPLLPVGALIVWLAACSGGRGQAPPASPASPGLPSEPSTRLEGATVFDANGHSKSCEPPREDCPKARSEVKFQDRCRSAGYQVRRCGCETVCSGKVESQRVHYDASGQVHDCAPVQAGCQPPDTPAAFQDACNDAGHHLVTCGCAWLCDGPPKRTQ